MVIVEYHARRGGMRRPELVGWRSERWVSIRAREERRVGRDRGPVGVAPRRLPGVAWRRGWPGGRARGEWGSRRIARAEDARATAAARRCGAPPSARP